MHIIFILRIDSDNAPVYIIPLQIAYRTDLKHNFKNIHVKMYADDSKLCSCAVILLLGLTLIRVHHNIITTWPVAAYTAYHNCIFTLSC